MHSLPKCIAVHNNCNTLQIVAIVVKLQYAFVVQKIIVATLTQELVVTLVAEVGKAR